MGVQRCWRWCFAEAWLGAPVGRRDGGVRWLVVGGRYSDSDIYYYADFYADWGAHADWGRADVGPHLYPDADADRYGDVGAHAHVHAGSERHADIGADFHSNPGAHTHGDAGAHRGLDGYRGVGADSDVRVCGRQAELHR